MISSAFWTGSGEGLQHAFFYLRNAMERPDGAYPGWVRVLFLTALPFARMASDPTWAFFEEFNAIRPLQIFVVKVTLLSVMVWVWIRGLRQHSSGFS